MLRFFLRVQLQLIPLMLGTAAIAADADRPNIVCVLFDDLGYGQSKPFVPESEFPMPNLEKLATEGMRFTDAHSAAAVCTPTRYGLLTGRYPCRIGQFGVATTFSPPIIPTSRLTIAGMLQKNGYHTACIGKWHLGLRWLDGKPGQQDHVPKGSQLKDGPLAAGFDVFFGFTHARNIGTIIEQNEVVTHVDPIDNQPLMIAKAVQYIEDRKESDAPFFLYFPMCPPHKPIAPAPEFRGKSGAADKVGKDPLYGDWVLQGDAMLGQILDALERTGAADNTLVFATSDNGAERRAYAPLRESKRSIYDGGHRVPFVVRWPGKVAPASETSETICLNDIFATTADILGFDIPPDAAEDSVSILPAMLQQDQQQVRNGVVHQSSKGDLAIRKGHWKLIFHRSGKRELYDMRADISETQDLSERHPKIVTELTGRMQNMIDHGRSTSGRPQTNEFDLTLEPKPTEKKRRNK